MDISKLSLSDYLEKRRTGECTAEEAAMACVDAIEKRDWNAFINLKSRDQLRSEAQKIDERVDADGESGPLMGAPIAVKDNICTASLPTTAASRILADFEPPYTATVVERLERAGALVIGKTNMDEFAMGSSNETSYFGSVRNPEDPDKAPGGSSGGSAASVAGDLCLAALGSDTGGSIRQPASHCGVVGLKPTYGRVSRYGLIAFASSLDQIGPISKSVADAAQLLEIASGVDENDATTVDKSVPEYTDALGKPVDDLTVGLPEQFFESESAMDPDVIDSVESAIDRLRDIGVSFEQISLPHTEYAVAAYYLIATAEASSNLARYDGVRYGYRAEADDLESMYRETRAEGFGDEVKRRIMLGTYVLSAGYYDKYYKRAQKTRSLIKRDFERAFDSVDLIAGPTAPTPAFELGEKFDRPLEMYMQDVFTVSCNLAGLPGLSMPCGRTSEDLPVGLQLIGPAFGEKDLFRLGSAFEQTAS